jgi:endonuclease YncB( thermonuclease family)
LPTRASGNALVFERKCLPSISASPCTLAITRSTVTHQITHSGGYFFTVTAHAPVAPHSAFFVNGMGGWALMMAAGLLAGAVLAADAENARADDARAKDASRCGADSITGGQAARILDARSFVMDDGREIRLAALEVPFDGDASAAGAGSAAQAALSGLLAGQTIDLRAAATGSDRYGRILAYAFTAGSGDRSVGHDLLARGHARVGAQIGDHAGDAACAAGLLSQERVARSAKLGLWSDPRYAIMEAGNLASLVAGRGRFAVVEGNVVSVRAQGGTIYVNFGRRWSQALTVTISKRQERMFAGAGLSPRTLENRRVRVRGWIEIRNGPRIEARRPEQIEIAGLN